MLADTHQRGRACRIRVHEIRLTAIPALRDEKRRQSIGGLYVRE
jgi:hypothetical protein